MADKTFMAAPTKKTQQKMSLGDFLQDETLGSWADEMEDMPLGHGRTGYGGGGERRGFGASDRFGGGLNDRGFSMREELPMPDKPPYTAHIGNLSFNVTEGEVSDYFADCEVTNVRIVEDKLEMKPKGFGYVEFATVDGLKKALDLNGSSFSGRNIRVSVAEPPKDRPDAREFGDWTRKGPLPDLPGQNRRVSERAGGGFGAPRNFDNASDAGSDRGERRRPFEQADNKVRDFGNWERRGPLSPAQSSGPPGRDEGRPRTNDGPRERRRSPAWGEGQSQEGSRPPRRDFSERAPVDRAPTAPEVDTQWRTKMRPDAPAKSPTPSRDTSNPPSPAMPSAPAMRPKLNLQKRTVSEAENPSPASASSDPKASPFGAAKPIDTFAKEKEIEEKRQLALRQKKEHEDKVKEEKRLAKEAAKAEKAAATAQSANGKDDKGEESSTPQPGFEVLQEGTEDDGALGEKGAAVEDEPENGEVVEEKSVKPKQIVRDMPPKKTENAWRGKSGAKKEEAAQAETSSDALEDDGWSTVSKSKNNRKGSNNPGARAIAS
ncbi:MAG: hypothetical protein M4579_002958 [Chaenotheca gracillima]|nr:MAG: hypothetical protein M4579_002958 [Chaenotheca gracillima]